MIAWIPLRSIVLLGLALVLFVPAAAQENDDCFMCHGESDMTGERDGEEISIFVDAELYGDSIHGVLECVDCHQDLVDAELPHDEELARVECAGCHRREARQHERSLHGQAVARGDALAPRCADCHTAHAIQPASDPASPTSVMNIPLLCGRCHREGAEVARTRDIPQEHILEHYSMSIHGEGLFQKGLTVTAVCTSCHTSHNILPHTDPESSIHHDRVARTCAQCHGEIEDVHRKVIEGRLWIEEPHKIPSCVDCHAPHRIRQVFYPAGLANQDCLTCHGKPDLATVRDGVRVSLHVDEGPFVASAHAQTACAQCHTDVTPALERPCETVTAKVDCAICHAEPVAEFESSTHGTFLAQGDPDAPSCQDCHTLHATQDHEWPGSPTFPRNVPLLCGKCHREGEQAAVRIDSNVPDIVHSYEDSIHGKGLMQSGLVVTATCVNCHSAHSELPPEDARSTVHPSNIADTCGTCHHGIEQTFTTSVHWPANTETDLELPTCEDCHSSHTISRIDQADFRFRMMDQCGRCHGTEAESFFDTFHGKVSRLGGEAAAKCYDCHGTHDILPPSDVDSHLSRRNVVETCGRCHEGSHRRFAGYLTHATHHDAERYPWLFWSFWAMTALLVGTLTFALMHTLAWLARLWLSREEWKASRARIRDSSQKLYRRFSRLQRTLHGVMMVSFFTLALTGMALKFSYMGWAQTVSRLLGGFESMGLLHRMGAIALLIVALLHLRDIVVRKNLRQRTWKEVLTGPDTILFTLSDLTELVQSVRWFFGLGPRPRYGRYTYWEKFDYFAVVWGIAIIGTTGIVLWFPELCTRLIPGWSVNVATIIHSDEALLAVGFIFTIHFFNTHFRPDRFPMDPVIFTGRVSLEELKHDKPREYERLVANGELERNLVDPMPAPAERGLKTFGAFALAVGLSLLVLIVYTMLFGYR